MSSSTKELSIGLLPGSRLQAGRQSSFFSAPNCPDVNPPTEGNMMIEVNVGMSRADWELQLGRAQEALKASRGEQFSFSIYGKNNGNTIEDVTVQFSNDDMESDQPEGACWIELVIES